MLFTKKLFKGKDEILRDGESNADVTVKRETLKEGEASVKSEAFKNGEATVKSEAFKNGEATVKSEALKNGEATVKSETLKNEEVTIKNKTLKKQETEPETLSDQEEYEIVEIEILPEKMICPDCGGITLAGLDFCDKCGGELGNYENY